MRRFLLVVLIAVGALVAGPPLYYAAFGDAAPSLPSPGALVSLADGTRINVLDVGKGPAVVLVHGLPGSAYDWRPLPQALAARGLRAIAYDRKGYGYSDRRGPDEPFTYEQNGRELVGLLEALDVTDATVVGWSFGGGTTIAAANQDNTRMARVTLLASVGPAVVEEEEPPLLARLIFSPPVLAWIALVPPVSRGAVEFISSGAFSNQPMPEWWVDNVRANLARPGTRRTQARESANVGGAALLPSEVGRPVLVIHGTEDWFVPFSVGEDLAARTGGPIFAIEGGSHMVPVTHAGVIADRLAAFIQSSP